jgi:hypothetical protein
MLEVCVHEADHSTQIVVPANHVAVFGQRLEVHSLLLSGLFAATDLGPRPSCPTNNIGRLCIDSCAPGLFVHEGLQNRPQVGVRRQMLRPAGVKPCNILLLKTK